jgi:hypothetical protein
MAAVGTTTPEDHALLNQIRKSLDEMERFFQQVIDTRRQKPGDDLVTDLLNAQVDGEALSNKEIQSFLALLLMAGTETTMSLLSLLVLKLARSRSGWTACATARCSSPVHRGGAALRPPRPAQPAAGDRGDGGGRGARAAPLHRGDADRLGPPG